MTDDDCPGCSTCEPCDGTDCECAEGREDETMSDEMNGPCEWCSEPAVGLYEHWTGSHVRACKAHAGDQRSVSEIVADQLAAMTARALAAEAKAACGTGETAESCWLCGKGHGRGLTRGEGLWTCTRCGSLVCTECSDDGDTGLVCDQIALDTYARQTPAVSDACAEIAELRGQLAAMTARATEAEAQRDALVEALTNISTGITHTDQCCYWGSARGDRCDCIGGALRAALAAATPSEVRDV